MNAEYLILVTGPTEAPHLSAIAGNHVPAVKVVPVHDLEALENAIARLQGLEPVTSLVAIATDVIIPSEILDSLPSRCFNFHAGPPEYPGSLSASFAVYEGAETFGVTLHRLAPEVDSGSILAVERFPVPPGTTAADLNGTTYMALIGMFSAWIERLMDDEDFAPATGEDWHQPARTRAQARDLSVISYDLEEDERDRRKRAFSII